MEYDYHVIALAGNTRSGKRSISSKLTTRLPISLPGQKTSYEYCGINYVLTDMENSLYWEVPFPEAIVLICDSLCLEQGLHQLKTLVTMDQIRDPGIPVVLCINFWNEAEERGILIDTELLQDVLQIPVVPCCSRCREHLDNLKAAIHYCLQPSHKGEFCYHCLDFAPGKLARECSFFTDAVCFKQETVLDHILNCPFTTWFLLFAALFSIFRLLI